MKLLKIALLLTSISLTAPSFAQSCGKIIANSFVKVGDYSVALTEHNNERLRFPDRRKFTTSAIESSGFASLKLAPGVHEFRGFAICISGVCDKSRIIGGSDADEVRFSINVEEGKRYKIAALPSANFSLLPGKRFDVIVSSENDIECAGEAKKALEEVAEETAPLIAALN